MKIYQEAVAFLQSKISVTPEIGMILGTGLSNAAGMIENAVSIEFSEVPNMPVSTAPSHQGKFVFGKLSGKNVVIMQGRVHYYEGYNMQQVTFPVRVLKLIGVELIIITNAAGSLNENLQPGDLVLIEDHINFFGTNPLIGHNLDEFGERFPSMNEPYSRRLSELCTHIAQEKGFQLKGGVYTGLTGPTLETRAECKMLVNLGSDLVGMSTVPEVIVAVHCGMEVLAISIVTNLSNIFHSRPHSQKEIQENADKSRENLEYLLTKLIEKI